jgi:hypothetical protein
MSRLRHCSARASSFIASQPPMLASGSFFALIVMPSARLAISRTMSGISRSAWPGSRSLMNHAFSANRHASRNSGTPKRSHSTRTPRRFSSETGCPPPELFVIVTNTTGTSAARSWSSPSSAPRSMLPLNGWIVCGSRPSGITRSTASAPVNSTFARVVSKCVLFGTTLPGPPITPNRIFSAARPWWVGITCGNGKSSCTASRKAYHDGEPA